MGQLSPCATTTEARVPWSSCHSKKKPSKWEAPALVKMPHLPSCRKVLSPFLSKPHQGYFVDIDKIILKCWKRRPKWQNESLAPDWLQWTTTMKVVRRCHRIRHAEHWNSTENPETEPRKCAWLILAKVVALSRSVCGNLLRWKLKTNTGSSLVKYEWILRQIEDCSPKI